MRILNLKLDANQNKCEYPTEDSILLKKCAEGDELSWQQLIKKYSNLVFNICFQYTANSQIAEELTQDIFIKVYSNCTLLSKHPNFKYWLIKTTKNRCIDYYRKNRLNNNVKSMDSNPVTLKSHDTPENKILLTEKIRQLHKAILQLPASLRTVIILRDINELSYEEIAKILKIPIGTVKSKLNRARVELFKVLGTFNYFNSF